MGGSLGRREATGRGCMIVTKEALKHLNMPIQGTTVGVQGFGNVGSVAAELLVREGCKIVAISDRCSPIRRSRMNSSTLPVMPPNALAAAPIAALAGEKPNESNSIGHQKMSR